MREKFERLMEDKDYVIQDKDYMILDKEHVIRVKDRMMEDKERVIQEKNNVIKDKERVIWEKDRMMENKERVIQEKDHMMCVIQDKDRMIMDRKRAIREKDDSINELETGFGLIWRKTTDAPVKFRGRGYTVVVGSKAYFYLKDTVNIYEYDTDTENWDTLPPTPERITGCCVVSIYNLFLTFISPSGKLYTYTSGNGGERWVEKFPPIGAKCCHPSCISTRDKVMVFSGIGRQGHILDLYTLEWTHIKLKSFDYDNYYRFMFRFIHNDVMYQAAGIDLIGNNNYFCSCPENDIMDGSNIPWKFLHKMPNVYQTLISFNGHILALGGRTSYWKTGTDEPSKVKSIYRYDVESNSWAECGEMEVARSECMVAVVGNKMVVVGGEDSQGASRTDIAIAV